MVGRDPNCELVLESAKCSRVHAKILVDGGALWVEDQKSTNGTYVNKQKISESTRLDNGDVLQFGDVRFRVIAPEEKRPAVEGTVMVGGDDMRRMLAEEEAKAAAESAKKEPGQADEAKKQPAAEEPRADAGKPEPGDSEESGKAPEPKVEEIEAGAPAKPGRSEEPAPATDKDAGGGKKRGDRSDSGPSQVPGRAEDKAGIPASWADADQLEQASQTAFVVRAPSGGDDGKASRLAPEQALARAREVVSAEDPILVGLTYPVQGKTFKLTCRGGTEKWEMGRGEGADIVLDDSSVSGRHAQLICEGSRWKIVNMMSVNGTFVNDRKVLSAYLKPHDVISMGAVDLVFDAYMGKSKRQSASKRGSPDSPSGLRKFMRWIIGKGGRK